MHHTRRFRGASRPQSRSARAFATTIRPGTVVSCNFPTTEDPHKPGNTRRPAVIDRVFFSNGRYYAVTVYGTTGRGNGGLEFAVEKTQDMADAGLHQPTRFVTSRMRILPIDECYFAYCEHVSPVLGYLPTELQKLLRGQAEKLAQLPFAELQAALLSNSLVIEAQHTLGQTSATPHQATGIDLAAADATMRAHLTGRSDDFRRISDLIDRTASASIAQRAAPSAAAPASTVSLAATVGPRTPRVGGLANMHKRTLTIRGR